ncbi:MAG: hypothetical protein ABGW77_00195 [Campylobacterales bacterium]
MREGFISPTLVALINLIIAVRFIATTTRDAYQIATYPQPLKELAGNLSKRIAVGVFDQSMNPVSRISLEAQEEVKPISRLAEKWERVAKKVDLNRTKRISVGAWGDLLYLEEQVREGGEVLKEQEQFYVRRTPSTPLQNREYLHWSRVEREQLPKYRTSPPPIPREKGKKRGEELAPEIILFR